MTNDPAAAADQGAVHDVRAIPHDLGALLATAELQELIAMTARHRVARTADEPSPSEPEPGETSPTPPATAERGPHVSATSNQGAPAAAAKEAVAGEAVVYVVGEIDVTSPGVRPLGAFRSREAAERWATEWAHGEVAAGRLAPGHDTTEVRAVPLDPAVPTNGPVEALPHRAGADSAPLVNNRPDLLDEDAVPLDGLTTPERSEVLERLAHDVLGDYAVGWWGAASPDTWDVAPRALLSSDAGARRVRMVLLDILRGMHGIVG
jgi:hypothetical protein